MPKSLFAFVGLLIALSACVAEAAPYLPVQGGTGTSTAPTYGKILVGTNAGVYQLMSTSSLGIVGAADGTFSTSSADHWQSVRNFFSTTSADHWQTQRNFFSTTSANYWASLGLGISTTSLDYWKGVRNFFSTTSVEYWRTTSREWAITSGYLAPTSSLPILINNATSTITNLTTVNATATKLVATYGSTTAISGSSVCISTDCRTSWPTGGGSGNVSTSSAETSGRIPYWTSTGATPAALSGGAAAFTWDNTNSRLSATNASTTNTTVSTLLTLGSGSVINWNEGNMTLTHSANTLTFSGGSQVNFGSLAVSSTGNVTPNGNNLRTLGSAGNQWSQLYLGSGAAVNFSNGDVALTHSTGNLTLSAGDRLNFDYGSSTGISAGTLWTTGVTNCTEALETNSAGQIICGTDATAAGAANDFSFATHFGATRAATSSGVWVQSNFFASSTVYISGNISLKGSALGSMFVGERAGGPSLTATNSTGVGIDALAAETGSGGANTAVGNNALKLNQDGQGNSALGYNALGANISGLYNSAFGWDTLRVTTGSYNTGYGTDALYSNVGGNGNTAVGVQAGRANTSGSNNTFIGTAAGFENESNYYLDDGTNITSSNLSNASAIGYQAQVKRSNSMVLGNNFVDVGIGTSTPYSRLTLWGTTTILEAVTGASTTVFKVGQSGATTTGLAATSLNAANCDLKADTNGNFYCGTDATGGGGASFGKSWEITSGYLAPTSTLGIIVNASSTLFNLTALTATTTSATTTNLSIGGGLSFGGVTGTSWSAFCISITGSASLCDGDDATGGGGGTYPFTPTSNFGATNQATTGIAWFQNGLNASSTSHFSNSTSSLATIGSAWISSLFMPEGSSINWDNGDLVLTQNGSNLSVTGGDFTVAPGNSIVFPNGSSNSSYYAFNNGGSGTSDLWITAFGSASLHLLNEYSYFDGNLGVGSSSPAVPLSVQGNALISGTTTATGFVATSSIRIASLNCSASNQLLQTDASGNIVCGTDDSGGAATAGGSDTQIQFNDGGSTIGGAAGFVWNKVKSLVGVGSTTPWAILSVGSSTYDGVTPFFAVSTSSWSGGNLFSISATTSNMSFSSQQPSGTIAGFDSGVRIGIGGGNGMLLDQVTLNGRINTGNWSYAECSAAFGNFTDLSADTSNACGQWFFAEDNNGTFTVGKQTVSITYGGATANDGAGLFLFRSTGFTKPAATSTPVFEATVSGWGSSVAASLATSSAYLGFTTTDGTGSNFEFDPTSGCFIVASSTRPNWTAVCKNTNANVTMFDSGIASTTYEFTRFRIEMDALGARFYYQTPTTTLTMFANITGMSVATTTQMIPGVYITRIGGGAVNTGFLTIKSLKTWFRNDLWRN